MRVQMKVFLQSFDNLKKFMGSFQVQDAKIKDYIVKRVVKQLKTGLIQMKWCVELTEEYFTNSLSLSELSINEDDWPSTMMILEILQSHAIEVVIDKGVKSLSRFSELVLVLSRI